MMLICGRSETENDGKKRTEMFNFLYPTIILKDNNNKIVDILKSEENETYSY